ncbi:MAG TPA: TonB family protein [Bryobacteraceae bacterium]|nr:TonB family protein [Bryobacteraceae bacterium]
MDTVAPPPVDADLHLLTEWGSPGDRSRRGEAALVSVLVHIALVVLLALVPATVVEQHHEQRVTPLIEPPTELTQTAPNKHKITKEFDSSVLQPRPRLQIPQGAPSTTRPRAPQPAPQPLPAAPPVPAALPEPPKVDAATPKPELPQVAQIPQIQPVERPKLELQNVAPPPPTVPRGQGRVAIPDASVQNAIRQAVRGATPRGFTLGDDLELGPGGVGEGINLPPSPGVQASQLELLSDPQGVDFRPYLTQVLAAVRRNWLAVIPESAKLGRRGRVSIQFAIAKDGSVPKLVITLNSGTDALDRGAVAGISASNPFPPLPYEYKGERIVLQFNFAYNMPRR